MKVTPGRPVLTVIRPDDIPDHRHGPRWWWFRVTEAAGTVRWHIVTAVAAVVAAVAPKVRGQAWREGFDVALCRGDARSWRQHLDEWHQGNQLAHEIVYRRHGQAWDGRQFTLCCPLPVPDPAGLSDLVARMAEEQLEYSGAARAEAAFEQARQSAAGLRRSWRSLGRIGGAVALMATAAVDARNQRVAALADAVAPRRIVVIEGRHAATPPRPGRPRSGGRQPPGRHARRSWRTAVARWLRDVIGWRETGAHRATGGPLRSAA